MFTIFIISRPILDVYCNIIYMHVGPSDYFTGESILLIKRRHARKISIYYRAFLFKFYCILMCNIILYNIKSV